jgi:glycosyltransferase domain-containing protein
LNTPRLTIVLPLKGRQLFTLRFLWHADSEKLPYRFVIADGQVAPKLASLLENSRELFPNLDIDYVRYPDDADFGHYFRKIADALHRVRTPYVMLADNDDFLVFTGLERSMDFLDAKLDYVCCGGGIAGFALYSPAHDGLVGPFNQFTYRYAARDRSFDAGLSSSAERLVSGFNNSWSYYAVFRSAALLEIWQDVVQIDFSDLQLLEIFCAMRTLTLGKARSDPATVAYLRQYWTSLRSAFPNDWVHHLLRSRFSTDFGTMVGRVSGVVASSDDCDEANIAERKLRDARRYKANAA